MAGSLITIGVTQLQEQRKGFVQISLTDFDLTSVSQIALGSRIEIAGALIQFTANESMGANWAAMSAGIVYAYIDGVALTSTYTATAPTWNTEKQGWYDVTGANRYYAKFVKDAGALYTQKALYTNRRSIMCLNAGAALNTGADADQELRFASDASILWDESEDAFVPNKRIGGAGVRTSAYIFAVNQTYNNMFDALSLYIPNTNNSILLTGVIYTGGAFYYVNRAVRSNATRISVYYIDSAGNMANFAFDDGVVTNLDKVAIAW
jgi:hypothetical protein